MEITADLTDSVVSHFVRSTPTEIKNHSAARIKELIAMVPNPVLFMDYYVMSLYRDGRNFEHNFSYPDLVRGYAGKLYGVPVFTYTGTKFSRQNMIIGVCNVNNNIITDVKTFKTIKLY